MTAVKKTRIKSPKGIVAEAPALFAQRQEGVWATGGGVRVLLRDLTWQEQERVSAMIQAMLQETRDRHKDSLPEMEDFDFGVESMWELRLGVHEIEELPDCPAETSAALAMAKQSMKEIEVGGVKRKIFTAEFFMRIGTGYTKGYHKKIKELTYLTQGEDAKLVFTSPSSDG